jgi:hypothetical protein
MKEAGDGGGGSRARAASKGRQRLMGACNKSRGGGHEHAQKARGDVARGRAQDLIFLPDQERKYGSFIALSDLVCRSSSDCGLYESIARAMVEWGHQL